MAGINKAKSSSINTSTRQQDQSSNKLIEINSSQNQTIDNSLKFNTTKEACIEGKENSPLSNIIITADEPIEEEDETSSHQNGSSNAPTLYSVVKSEPPPPLVEADDPFTTSNMPNTNDQEARGRHSQRTTPKNVNSVLLTRDNDKVNDAENGVVIRDKGNLAPDETNSVGRVLPAADEYSVISEKDVTSDTDRHLPDVSTTLTQGHFTTENHREKDEKDEKLSESQHVLHQGKPEQLLQHQREDQESTANKTHDNQKNTQHQVQYPPGVAPSGPSSSTPYSFGNDQKVRTLVSIILSSKNRFV